jgi:hypothetical protein
VSALASLKLRACGADQAARDNARRNRRDTEQMRRMIVVSVPHASSDVGELGPERPWRDSFQIGYAVARLGLALSPRGKAVQ